MQVLSYGISLSTENKQVNISHLFNSLAKKNGSDNNQKSLLRRIYVDTTSDADFFLGMIVTIKDQRRFLQLTNGGGALKVKVSDLKGENKLLEFNFFAINKANGLGLYQYYHGSCSPLTFGSYLRSEFREIADTRRDLALGKVEKKRGSKKIEDNIRRELRPPLEFQQLVRKDNIEAVLERYKKIVSFEYDVVAVDSISQYARPLSGLVRKIRQRVRFNTDSPKETLVRGIAEMMPNVEKNSARVAVLNDDDEPVSIRVIGMPENFGEQDYDVVAEAMDDLDLTKFQSHPCLESLMSTCRITYSSIFMVKFDE
ncbi:TPA: hypothetical protein QDZ28_004988 [Pseudomonas putida]|nr:hypothetical protein [Pseudomonas putida]